MTSATSYPARVRPPRWMARLQALSKTYFAPGDWVALVVVTALLLMPAYALIAAGWAIEPAVLMPTIVLSILIGFVIARSEYGELLGLMLSILYGGSIILIAAGLSVAGNVEGIRGVFDRILTWGYDAVTGGINQDDLVFTVLVSGLFWSLGYNLTWHVFRIDRVFRAVLPPGLVLIGNAVYYTGSTPLEPYLIGFLFLTLVLIVRSNLETRQWEWFTHGIRVPRRLRFQVFWIGALLAAIVLGAAWAVPRSDLEERLRRFQEFLDADPLRELGELWNRLFSSIETQGPTTTDYFGSDTLELGGAIQLGEDPVFLVSAPNQYRYYWRSRTFDFYDRGRWTSAADTRLTDPEAPLDILPEAGLSARVQVPQTFSMQIPASRLVYAAPQPVRIELATRTDLRYATDRSMVVSVIRPLRVLRAGNAYGAISSISIATADQLRSAGTNYPEWVRSTYTAFIPSLTGRTLQLARQIVTEAGAVTPYDQARAIETWLRANIAYNEIIPPPPVGQDPVDWVLFDLRQGYCNYYASAMVVMLRSLGIPARMAAGFAQGEWDPLQDGYIVRERDAHTWVEVYFPGYGWVEFEPTSAQLPIDRGDMPLPRQGQPTPLPTNTPEPPTSTPTPLPTSTPEPVNEATAEATTDPEALSAPPTVTPTPTPTPTPVVVPPQPPAEDSAPRQSLLDPIIAALRSLFLLFLILMAVFALGVFAYWWWEWRGLRGLSPFARAYGRLMRYVRLIGVRAQPQETPEERRRLIVRQLPAIEKPVTSITGWYALERYGVPRPTRLDETNADRAKLAWHDARSGILRRWLRRRILFWKREQDTSGGLTPPL
ncbi:MAG: transglutaminase family protein [Candidatus Flexifilum sp.]